MPNDSGYSVDMIIKSAFEYELNNYINTRLTDNPNFIVPEQMAMIIVKEYLDKRVKEIKERHK